jgi:hypothetical protein
MTHASVRNSWERGSALVSVVVLLLGILVMGYAFFRATVSNQRSVRESVDEQRSFFLAEAGLHESFEAIRTGRSGNVGSAEAPARLGGGVLWVTATPIGDDRTSLLSTAMAGSGRNALEAVVHLRPDNPPLFVATLNSKEVLTLNEGVMIDSFDSAVGTYESQAVNPGHGYTFAGANGDVRSNDDVVLNARATVFGDATPGPGFGVEFNTGSYVDGSIESAEEPFVFPPIAFPAFTAQGNYTVAGGATSTLGPGNYDFDAFTINKNGTLRVTGPATLVVDSFTGGKTAKLIIDATAGPVTVYVRGAYTHTSGFEASAVAGSPMALAFLVDGKQDVVFPSNTKVRGAYYTPNADILFASGNECWGAFAANRISMANDMRFHFDETLLKHWGGQSGDDGDRLTVLSWRKTAVTPASLIADRRDPLEVLGLDSGDLSSPGYSWQD